MKGRAAFIHGCRRIVFFADLGSSTADLMAPLVSLAACLVASAACCEVGVDMIGQEEGKEPSVEENWGVQWKRLGVYLLLTQRVVSNQM